jgi:hypothetical protein
MRFLLFFLIFSKRVAAGTLAKVWFTLFVSKVNLLPHPTPDRSLFHFPSAYVSLAVLTFQSHPDFQKNRT